MCIRDSSITVNIDITNLYNYIKTNKLRFYPTFTWVVSKAINNYQEFKMAFDEEGRLGFFDEIGPSYSVLNDKTKVMSDLYTPFNNVFSNFYKDMENALNSYKQDTNFTTKFQKMCIRDSMPTTPIVSPSLKIGIT